MFNFKHFFWARRKSRIRMDNALLTLVLILTGLLLFYKQLYLTNQLLDNILDFLGFIAILKGNFLRLTARGHKKKFDRWGLVTTGPYSLVRNPMYLGSLIIGMGFVLIIWPWWSLPLFVLLFYLRFIHQIKREEEQLLDCHKEVYQKYLDETPRLFPSVKSLRRTKINEIFNVEEAMSSKDVRNMWCWLLLAILLECLQESFVFGYEHMDLVQIILLFVCAGFVFVIGFWITRLSLRKQGSKNSTISFF